MSTEFTEWPEAISECPEVAVAKAKRIARETGRSSVLARNGKRKPAEAWDAFDSQLSMPEGYRVKAWVLATGSIRVIA